MCACGVVGVTAGSVSLGRLAQVYSSADLVATAYLKATTSNYLFLGIRVPEGTPHSAGAFRNMWPLTSNDPADRDTPIPGALNYTNWTSGEPNGFGGSEGKGKGTEL